MSKFVFSYRVPAGYAPGAETASEWQAWLGGMGSSLVDFGHAVTDYASLGEVGGSESRFVGYSVVDAESLEAAVVIAKGCPALKAGGGIEVGPVMEVPAS